MRFLTALALYLCAGVASAHDLTPEHRGVVPALILLMLVAAGLYARGAGAIWRGPLGVRRTTLRRALFFGSGWIVLATALLSPLDEWGAHFFTAHMIQHELLMLVAAPLLVAGYPLGTWAWALPPRSRVRTGRAFKAPGWRRCWAALSDPASAWTLHAAALWLWHVPALFLAARADETVHLLQHVSFFASALLFWWVVLRGRRPGSAILALFTTMLHTGALGALLVFAGAPFYAENSGGAAEWGYTALEDQQLGGLVMWIPGSAVYLICSLVIAARRLRGDAVPNRASPERGTAADEARLLQRP